MSASEVLKLVPARASAFFFDRDLFAPHPVYIARER